jgi:hypothetical protein
VNNQDLKPVDVEASASVAESVIVKEEHDTKQTFMDIV